jgi:ATP-dependent Lon protease
MPAQLLILPTPGPVLFPTLILPLIVWHQGAIQAVEEALTQKKILGMLVTREEHLKDDPKLRDLFDYGMAVRILKRIKLPDGNIQILVQALKRFRVRKSLSEEPFLLVEPEYFEDAAPEKSLEIDALTRNIINHVKELSETNPFFTDEMRIALVNAPHTGVAADVVAFALGLPKTDAQEFLETIDVYARFQLLLKHLKREQEVATLQRKINDEVNGKVNSLQRDFFLKEQLKLIKKELGMEEEGKEKVSRTFRERIAAADMPKEVHAVAMEELNKFETIHEASPEYNITRNYLETLVSLPWNKRTKDDLRVERARKILDEDHFGLEHVKDRIIEFLSVRKLKAEKEPDSHPKGSIILLVGPPGVGKTSIGKSIARAMGRNFHRFSLGGMRDEAEIKGHRRTYIGAMPGKFIQAARRVESKNPVILLDEVDKIAQSYHGDPAAALLEVLDPEQNNAFADHYLDLPFDLSEVLFVCTANSTSTIPAALLDRMEIIELSGYTLEEKEQIAKRFILPKVLESSGMTASTLKLPRATIRAMIQDYAREPGLRVLHQQIEKLARKVASKIVERRESREKIKLPITIEPEELRSWLGAKRFFNEVAERAQEPGVGIGLAWTPMGGEILFIETTELPGTGQMKLTGQMGDVMQESAALAWTFVKRRLYQETGMTQADLKDKDFHVHLPAGAIPKDGPSAGITLAATLYSLITGRKMRPFWAMTGELSLTGKVLPVGGVKEKLLAARRAGIRDVIIPEGNRKDLLDLPVELLRQLRIHPVKMVDEVFGLALESVRKSTRALITYSGSQAN